MCATMASASTWTTRTNSSACFTGFTARASSRARVSAWPTSGASSNATAAAPGPKAGRRPAPRFISRCPQSKSRKLAPPACSSRLGKALRTTQAFTAVQALVTGAVAHRDVAAVRTGRRILLEVRQGVAQARNRAALWRAVAVALSPAAVRDVGPQADGGVVFRQRQLRDRSVYFFFNFLEQTGHGQVRLFHAVGLAIIRDKLQRHPAEDVINDRGRIANLRVLGETGRLEPLVGEFLHQRLQRHSVLQRHAGQRADAVHQPADGRAFLGHGDEQLARLAVPKQADGEITFVAGDVELVGDGRAGLWKTTAQGLDGLGAQPDNFFFEFLEANGQLLHFAGALAPFAGLPGVERLRTFRAIAINRDALEAHFPGIDVGIPDVGGGRLVRQVDRF